MTVETTGAAKAPSAQDEQRALWRELAQQLRVDAIRETAAAGSGHPTSAMSPAELMAVLLEKYLHYDFENPHDRRNDRLVFSKGHASALLYAMYKAAGAVTDAELLKHRKLGSRLEGHPTPVVPYVDVATGSLGQGLPLGVGMALAGARLDDIPFHVWVLCGDSEMTEGSVWEAFEHAAYEHLDNLTAIVDVNRLGQTGPTMHGWDLDNYVDRALAFGWHAVAVDGHDVDAVDRAYAEARDIGGRPTAIFARTEKGHGVRAVADKNGFHGKPLPNPEAAIAELGGERHLHVHVHKPESARITPRRPPHTVMLPAWEPGESEATRVAFGETVVALGHARADIVVLDGEVGNSTCVDRFARDFPERFLEMYIAEQQLVAAAVGIQVLGWRPVASTFAAFMSRAHDFIRMAAVSDADIILCGSHVGVSIGADGPSQMGLEDIAMMRATFGSTVLYPCDANQTAALLAEVADRAGVIYLRTTRGKTPVIYEPTEAFAVGKLRVLRRSVDDVVTLVGAGVTVHEALAAADALAADGISARVIDLYSIKPVDEAGLREAALDTGRIITVEDHYPEGGLGDAVLEAVASMSEPPRVKKLAVRRMPGSATPEEQLKLAGIDAAAIADAARALVRGELAS